MKFILGIIIGIILALSVGTVYAENKKWVVGYEMSVYKFQDGNINCYVAQGKYIYSNGNTGGISCVKVN